MAVPSAISDLAASPADASVGLAWSAPSASPAISDYVVDYALAEDAKITTAGETGCILYGGGQSRAVSSNFELRIDLMLDDWTPATTVRPVGNSEIALDFSASAVTITYANSSGGFASSSTTAATLGLVDGVRAQIAIEVQTFGGDNVYWDTRQGEDIRALLSDIDWTQQAATTLVGTTNLKPAYSGSCIVQLMAGNGGSSTPSINGDFFGALQKDLLAATIDFHVLASDVSSVAYAAAFTGTDAQSYATYYNPTPGQVLGTEDPGLLWDRFADGVSSSTGATVTGLSNANEVYRFRTAAVNADGQGGWSNIEEAAPSKLGIGSTSTSFSATASGTRTATGAATASLAFSVAASGTRTAKGVALCSLALSTSASGVRERLGAAPASLAFTTSASGLHEALGAGSTALAFSSSANGQREALGAASAALALSTSASGVRERLGAGSAALMATTSATGQRDAFSGAASASTSLSATASGARTATGAASASLAFSATAEGTKQGDGSASTGFSASASGTRTAKGAASCSLALSATSESLRTAIGSGSGSWAFSTLSDSQREALGSASSSMAFACLGAGVRTRPAPSGSMAFSMATSASGSRLAKHATLAGPRRHVTSGSARRNTTLLGPRRNPTQGA